MSANDHEHPEPTSRWRRLTHFLRHEHDHSHEETARDLGAEGIRATKISLLGLGATALLQSVLVVITGSVALLSDTIHNFTDALTAIPLWIAFALGRRPHNRRYTYGYHRAEDLAGVVIVIAIGLSAGGVAWESIRRFSEPRVLDFPGWVIAAGVIGALGNELVARYRRRVGLRIGSAALVADADHARADALTSLAVVVAGIGAVVGLQWVDPVAGLGVSVMILRLLWTSSRSMLDRLMDAIDPEVVDRIESKALETEGVEAVADIRARHQGHLLLITLCISVDPEITMAQGHEIAHEVEHGLLHEFPNAGEAVVHVDPVGDERAHNVAAHHR
ncbi:MAG: cation diffusion facilitator family transporter [Acidimicrobiia bacterium]|nr:cation diffusion facilitator family transporter [Acidimicrobiia bacterium]